ncbi:MAG: hypothetical protein V7K32_07280 [Nostoc sp.]|uniref:hypothetical protein n=1 Tax=Nostoc sp. TaxID=1180 RepID=UPI002FF6EE21
MRQFYLFLSALFVSVSAVDQSVSAQNNQPGSNHDYNQALVLATSAINGCYQYKRLDECDKLNQIKATLTNWCIQGDNNACELYSLVSVYETTAQLSEIR